MKKIFMLLSLLLIYGCTTFATKTSMTVIEYKDTNEMASFAECESLGAVYASYGVFLHFTWSRKRAAHIHLKDAAYEKGANAVIMTSNNWGVITDQVQGVAYKCTYSNINSL